MELINMEEARQSVSKNGFLNISIDPSLDLFLKLRLKKEKNMVVLAHYYQEADIQDVADYIGDSLGLAQEAAKTKADSIVFAEYFMAETAKILNPEKKFFFLILKPVVPWLIPRRRRSLRRSKTIS